MTTRSANGPPPQDVAESGVREGLSPVELELERRLVADEERLEKDERRLAKDEQRLLQDEARLAEDETGIRRNWWAAIGIGALVAMTIAALVIGLVALNRDIETVAKATPKNDSVGTAAIQDAAVTGAKLHAGAVTAGTIGTGAVTGGAIAAKAVTSGKIAPGAVTGASVAGNALTGADIAESTLGTVPAASWAGNTGALGGVAASRYARDVTLVSTATSTGTLSVRGPVLAYCPTGTRVVGGGASIDGARSGVAITTSTPSGTTAWSAEAVAASGITTPWRLVVTAICAHGG